jgi:hypothetical protein
MSRAFDDGGCAERSTRQRELEWSKPEELTIVVSNPALGIGQTRVGINAPAPSALSDDAVSADHDHDHADGQT